MHDIPQSEDENDRNWWPVVAFVIVVACLVAAAYIRFVRDDDDGSGRQDASAPAVSSSTPSEEATAAPQESENAGAIDSSTTAEEIGTVLEDLSAFVSTFYQVAADDSAEVRKARLEQAGLPLAPDLIAGLDFQDGIEEGQVYTAELTGEYEVTDVHGNGNLLYVIAPAELIATKPDGSVVEEVYGMTASTWSYDDGWIMTAYNDAFTHPGE